MREHGTMMTLIGFVTLLLFASFVARVALAMLIDIARRLFWIAAQVATSAAVAAVGAICALGVAPPDMEWAAAPVALALAMGMLLVSRSWGSALVGAATSPPVRVVDATDFRRTPDEAVERAHLIAARGEVKGATTRARSHVPTSEEPSPATPLLTPALRGRLSTTEVALAHAARDAIGQPAADWLTFWRRRVPDLITSAQDVWDDTSPTERPALAADLAASLDGIITEADTRLAAIRKTRRDVFTTLSNHARARMHGG